MTTNPTGPAAFEICCQGSSGNRMPARRAGARIIVHTSEPSSGAAHYIREFVAGLAANKASVTLFCPPTFDYVREARSCGAAVIFAAHRSIERAGRLARVARNVRYVLV